MKHDYLTIDNNHETVVVVEVSNIQPNSIDVVNLVCVLLIHTKHKLRVTQVWAVVTKGSRALVLYHYVMNLNPSLGWKFCIGWDVAC